MKRRVSDIAVMILSFLVLLALSAETALVGVEAVRGEQWQLIRLTAWLQGSGVWGGIACIAVAVLALVLALMCLWRVFPHRTASQRGYVMQKNENGSIGVSIRAIEGLIRTCIDKHEAIAKADITVEECRDGIAIGLHIIQAAGVNIPLSVGALQKQIKQYVTACTGVDVYKIRVMVENDASIPVASTYEVQDVTPLRRRRKRQNSRWSRPRHSLLRFPRPSRSRSRKCRTRSFPRRMTRTTNVRCISACSARRSSPRLCPRRRR